MTKEHNLTINNKKYPYSLKKTSATTTRVVCLKANINQNFLNEDIPALLIDLPHLIIAEKKYSQEHDTLIRFRVSARDKKVIEKKAVAKGYATVSEYLREAALA